MFISLGSDFYYLLVTTYKVRELWGLSQNIAIRPIKIISYTTTYKVRGIQTIQAKAIYCR